MIKYLLKRWWVQALIVLAVCATIELVGFAVSNAVAGTLGIIVAVGVWLTLFSRTTRPKRRVDGSPR